MKSLDIDAFRTSTEPIPDKTYICFLLGVSKDKEIALGLFERKPTWEYRGPSSFWYSSEICSEMVFG